MNGRGWALGGAMSCLRKLMSSKARDRAIPAPTRASLRLVLEGLTETAFSAKVKGD